jgi:hypothetical protein
MFSLAVKKKYLMGILFTLSFFLYVRTLKYEFVWDDERVHLTENTSFMKSDIASFWKTHPGMYIPLTYTTWSFVKQAFSNDKLSPKPFHLLNIIFHSINCLLLFQLLFVLFKDQASAFWGSLLFLLHPMQVESVAWISEFRGLYSAFFCFLSLLSIVSYLDKNAISSVRSFVLSGHFIAATLLFILALLSKPSAIVLPFIAAILTWCFYKEKLLSVLKALLIWLLPIIVIVCMLMLKKTDTTILLWQRFFIAGDSLFFYIYKLIIPYPLVACYGFTPQLILTDKLCYFTTLAVISIMIVLFLKRRSSRILFTGFAIIFFCLLPVLGLIPFDFEKYSNVADRYFYFAMFGVALWMARMVSTVKKYKYLKIIFVNVFVVLFLLNIRQTATWQNEFTLWDNTLKHYQNNSTVYYNRGVQYSKIGNYDQAIDDYTKSIALQNDYIWALANRANAYEYANNLNAALNDYQKCFKIDSTQGSIYYNRACLNYRMGKIDEAIHDATKAERLNFTVNAKFKKVLQETISKQGN